VGICKNISFCNIYLQIIVSFLGKCMARDLSSLLNQYCEKQATDEEAPIPPKVRPAEQAAWSHMAIKWECELVYKPQTFMRYRNEATF
jgi:hypothetical protein